MTTSSSLPMLSALRKAISTVVKLDHRDIVLQPNPKQKGQGGVYSTVPVSPREPQQFTISVRQELVANADGVDGAAVHPFQYSLSGAYDAQIAVGDTWIDGLSTYRVVEVLPKNDYETQARAIGFGPDPNYGG